VIRRRTGRLIATGAALALVAGGGAAYAAGTSHAAKKSAGRGAIVRAAAGYLGLTPAQLRADLVKGQSLAQIANAQNKSVSGLEQTIETALKARLDAAVAAGKLSSTQEATILAAVSSRLDKLINTAHPGLKARIGARLRRGLIRVSATYLGVTPAQLRTELKAGKTLAQVATEHGKTVAGLEQAIETAVTNRLDKAVAAGKLTGAQEQRILSNLQSRLDKLVNRTFAHA
jgi:hypothetical protein